MKKNDAAIELYSICTPIHRATVVHRPSKVVKSPYMADVIVGKSTQTVLAHSPSLGVCGLVSPDASVIVSEKERKNQSIKSEYSIDMVIVNKKTVIGVNPYYANHMIYKAIEEGIIYELGRVSMIRREVKVGESRLDFVVTSANGHEHYIEVKSVPIAHDGVAVFPDGYRKRKTDTVSPRAVKHLETLRDLAAQGKSALLVFAVQRDDVHAFAPFEGDRQYCEAFEIARKAGVVMVPLQICWKKEKAFYMQRLPLLQ